MIAIFLGGMALGALIAGARSERLHDPLKWYVGAELIVGVIGLFFHEIFSQAPVSSTSSSGRWPRY